MKIALRLAPLALAIVTCLPGGAPAAEHCAAGGVIAPAGSEPGCFRIEAGGRSTVARWPAPAPDGAAVPSYVIRALESTWEVDGSAETPTDTLVVIAGSTVRWQRVAGIHTLTNGKGSTDDAAGGRFDYLLDALHPVFDSTFTVPDTVEFFCFFHEPGMRGVLIVSASAGVPGDRLPARLGFTRPPRPNPTRGGVSFAVGVPREQHVRLHVLDVNGRRVALLHSGPLAPGEHPFRWRGADDHGAPARAGIYVVHLQAGGVTATRRVSLLR